MAFKQKGIIIHKLEEICHSIDSDYRPLGRKKFQRIRRTRSVFVFYLHSSTVALYSFIHRHFRACRKRVGRVTVNGYLHAFSWKNQVLFIYKMLAHNYFTSFLQAFPECSQITSINMENDGFRRFLCRISGQMIIYLSRHKNKRAYLG